MISFVCLSFEKAFLSHFSNVPRKELKKKLLEPNFNTFVIAVPNPVAIFHFSLFFFEFIITSRQIDNQFWSFILCFFLKQFIHLKIHFFLCLKMAARLISLFSFLFSSSFYPFSVFFVVAYYGIWVLFADFCPHSNITSCNEINILKISQFSSVTFLGKGIYFMLAKSPLMRFWFEGNACNSSSRIKCVCFFFHDENKSYRLVEIFSFFSFFCARALILFRVYPYNSLYLSPLSFRCNHHEHRTSQKCGLIGFLFAYLSI